MTSNCQVNSPMDLSPASMDCSPSPLMTEETIVTETHINTSIVKAVTVRKDHKKRITKKKVSKYTKNKKVTSEKVYKKKSFRKVNTKKATAKKPAKKTVSKKPEPPAKEDVSAENCYKPKKLRFRAWKVDDYVIKVLEKRGWKFVGEPSELGRDDYPKSMKQERIEGKLDNDECLIWADDDDARVLQGYASNHLISCLPSSDKALTKIYQQTMFNDYDWFPTCWTLPEQNDVFMKFVNANPESYYICKPPNSYGGFGMCVYKAKSEEFMKLLDRKCPFVVQRYMHDPYMFAGLYKFHFRCYMVVTNQEPLKAYLYKSAQIQFCTHKFDLKQIEKSFNKYCHITNYKVNNEKKNAAYLLNEKPGIGKGSEWPIKKFFEYMEKHEPKWDTAKFWKDLTDIAAVAATQIASSPMVSKSFEKKGAMQPCHFEIYGLDVIINEKLELQLTEANTQPGLDDTKPIMADGVFNPTIVEANDVTEGIINDTLNLLDIDNLKTKEFAPFIPLKSTAAKK